MKYKGRSIVITVVIMAVFAGLGVRLAFLHLRPSPGTLDRIASGRHLEQKIHGPRGRILDRNGNMLAVDIDAQNLCVDPQWAQQWGETQAIGELLIQRFSMEPAKVWEILNRPNDRYEVVQKFMRKETLAPLKERRFKGLVFENVLMRDYPKGVLGAHVVGYASRYERVGCAGMEMEMNSVLTGVPGLRVSQKDANSHEIYSRRTVDIEPQPGADVYLTVDQQIQHFAEVALDHLSEKFNPEAAWAIVQNVRTGEILAMASLPTYNPNRYDAPEEWKRNRTISYNFEPGSTMKAIIIASALDAGIVKPTDMFDCENGRWYYGGSPLDDSHGLGITSVADIIKKSSNIGAAKVALLMGNAKVHQTLLDFGFGAPTGIELPAEERGIVNGLKNWSKISITRIAMGHEVAVTALQMISAISAIANDGIRLRPYIIRKVVSASGDVLQETQPQEVGRPIRPDTAKEMRRLLARVTQPGGTGTAAALPGYLVAGKTGTAQKVMENGGGYYQHKFFASFIGFLPVENPAISIIVVADNPQQGGHYGGTVCAPYFHEIADQTVRYLRIPPEGFPTDYLIHMNTGASGEEDISE